MAKESVFLSPDLHQFALFFSYEFDTLTVLTRADMVTAKRQVITTVPPLKKKMSILKISH